MYQPTTDASDSVELLLRIDYVAQERLTASVLPKLEKKFGLRPDPFVPPSSWSK
jgi:hypothetical protein